MALEVSSETETELVRIVVAGELDMTNADQLERAIYDAEAQQGRGLLLDLGRVEYFDSTGLGLLLDADLRAKRDGRRLVVITGDGEAARVLQLVNVRDRLTAAELE